MAIELSENRKKFDCHKCSLNHLCGEKNDSFPNSNGYADFPLLTIERSGLIFELKSCPLPMIEQRTYYFFQLYLDYKRGNLLASGGVNDQPNVYMQAMRVLSGH